MVPHGDVGRKLIKQDLVKESEKDASRTCTGESDKTGFERCVGEISDPGEVAGELFLALSSEAEQGEAS